MRKPRSGCIYDLKTLPAWVARCAGAYHVDDVRPGFFVVRRKHGVLWIEFGPVFVHHAAAISSAVCMLAPYSRTSMERVEDKLSEFDRRYEAFSRIISRAPVIGGPPQLIVGTTARPCVAKHLRKALKSILPRRYEVLVETPRLEVLELQVGGLGAGMVPARGRVLDAVPKGRIRQRARPTGGRHDLIVDGWPDERA